MTLLTGHDSSMDANIAICRSEIDMQVLAGKLASSISAGEGGRLMTLAGDLGVGKSVLARAVIHALGYSGRVKSPTYTLIETYDLPVQSTTHVRRVAHMDLYRLSDADELHYLAIDDILIDNDLVLVEWPDKGAPLLPVGDIVVEIDYLSDESRRVRYCFNNRNSVKQTG